MSGGFVDNPFGDPNDFGQTTNRPPPTIQPSGNAPVQTDALENFNPFQPATSQPAPPPFSQPAVLESEHTPPAYSALNAQRVTTEELERRQRELEIRAAELQRKEEEQRRREEQSKFSGDSSGTANNWPPLPSFCPMKPCFYQDFDLDIPLEFRRLVRNAYYLWLIYILVLILNVIGTLAYFIGDSGGRTSGITFGSSILFLIIMTPCSFVCWYRPLYKAFKNDSSFNFFMFFILFLTQAIIAGIQALGIEMLPSCGIINSLSMFKVNTAVAIIMLIIAIMFIAITVLDVFLLIKVHRIYRSTGASFEKAKQEFSQNVASNQAVRGAVVDLGGRAAQESVNSAANSGRRF